MMKPQKMNAQNVEPNGKPANGALDAEHNEAMELDIADEPDASTNITDLDNDCLEYIFKKLELKDLLNVADASKCFKGAVDLVYASKYSKMKVWVSIFKDRSSEGPLSIYKHVIRVEDRLSVLRLLRCFGHLIFDLRVGFDNYHWRVLDQYLTEYCADSLKKLDLWRAPKEAMEQHTKPFVKIEEVVFTSCNLSRTLTDFNKWFPQMRCLTIGLDSVVESNCIDKYFPNLQDLNIYSCVWTKNYAFKQPNIAGCIRQNPQLRSLDISGNHVDEAFLQCLNKNLHCLESLEIWCNKFLGPNTGVIRVRNVRNFTLQTGNLDFMRTGSLSFDRLESFTVSTNISKFDSGLVDFIRQHRSTLTKVRASSLAGDWLKNVSKMELAAAMDQLTEIDLGGAILSSDDVTIFLDTCKMLKSLRFRRDPNSEYDDLLQRFGNEWRMSGSEIIEMQRI